MRHGPHFNPAFLGFLGEMLLFLLLFALGLEMLAVARRKTRDLAGQPRWKLFVYWAIPIALAVVLLAWLVLRSHHRTL